MTEPTENLRDRLSAVVRRYVRVMQDGNSAPLEQMLDELVVAAQRPEPQTKPARPVGKAQIKPIRPMTRA